MSGGPARRSRRARDLTAFQRAILAVLAEGPTYGLAVKRELEGYYEEDINHGRLYPNLDELVDRGLVDKGEFDRRTNRYELTEEGEAAIYDALAWLVERFVTDEERARLAHQLVEHAAADGD